MSTAVDNDASSPPSAPPPPFEVQTESIFGQIGVTIELGKSSSYIISSCKNCEFIITSTVFTVDFTGCDRIKIMQSGVSNATISTTSCRSFHIVIESCGKLKVSSSKKIDVEVQRLESFAITGSAECSIQISKLTSRHSEISIESSKEVKVTMTREEVAGSTATETEAKSDFEITSNLRIKGSRNLRFAIDQRIQDTAIVGSRDMIIEFWNAGSEILPTVIFQGSRDIKFNVTGTFPKVTSLDSSDINFKAELMTDGVKKLSTQDSSFSAEGCRDFRFDLSLYIPLMMSFEGSRDMNINLPFISTKTNSDLSPMVRINNSREFKINSPNDAEAVNALVLVESSRDITINCGKK